ncbi:MAG: FAD-dependent oxidoreductase [Clostridiales bacterium]|nr:FAD-dependent oxidoreductase [Clostridiales bacterium]
MSENIINLKIDGKDISVKKGTTILDAARANGIEIPTLCHSEYVKAYGACGLCLVEGENMPKLMRACSTVAGDGMVINTMSPRVVRARKIALELIMSDHDGDCKAPCTKACPANTDCQGYVGLIANGEYKKAVEVIKEALPLPASIGRICPHPCEKECRRHIIEEPISIAQLKFFAADKDLAGDTYIPEIAEDTGKRVAIIGGGPGGLSAAYFLRRKGHSVKVYDKMPQMGGMLRYGIPQYRLPKNILDKEVALIENMGVELINNVRIGESISFEQIRKENDAVIVAVGAWKSMKMRVKGEEQEGVFGGIDFLRNVILGEKPEIGDMVAVCGGGNTAMDACRTAVRLGAKKVYVIYRRTRNEMPAEDIEIKEAEEEGVIYKFLTNPVEFTGENGRVNGVKLQIMELGEPDASGRRSPVPVEGKFESIELDSVIMAIGQGSDLTGIDGLDLTKKGTISADENSFVTSQEGVFAIGDVINRGAGIAISAIGHAKKAAIAVDAYLNGVDICYKEPYYSERVVTRESFPNVSEVSRVKMSQLSPEERKHNFDEVVRGYTEEEAQREAHRCLGCGCHDYYDCKLIKLANNYDIDPARFAGEKKTGYVNKNDFIERDVNKCILCGLCVRACSEVMNITAIGLVGRGFKTVVSPAFALPLDKTNCNACGLCVQLCPTGALQERSLLAKQVPVKEKPEKITCTECDKNCTVAVSYVGGKVARVIPADKQSLNCVLGRQELIERISKKLSDAK